MCVVGVYFVCTCGVCVGCGVWFVYNCMMCSVVCVVLMCVCVVFV